MSRASGGNIFEARSDAESGCPSRTILPAVSIACFITGVDSESAAVSSDCTSGMPPVSSVLRIRESCATWYFSQISPATGSFILIRSSRFLAASRRDHQRNPAIPATSVPASARI